MKPLSNNAEYCRAGAAPEGSNLHYALLFESDAAQERILPVFALHHEIAGCLTASSDPGVNRLKLQWWCEELERLSAGGARHPVTLSLQHTGRSFEAILPPLRRYLAAIISITGGHSHPIGFDDWYSRLTGELGQLWLAARDPQDRPPSADLSLHVANGGNILLLDLVQDSLPLLSRGYRLYPDDLLELHQCTHDDLIAPGHGTVSQGVFQTVIDRIADRLDTDYTCLPRHNRTEGWYELILNRLAAATCGEIRDDAYRLLQHRIALTPLRKFWIAVRTRYLG